MRDFGRPWSHPDVRVYQTAEALPLHVDGADVAGLRGQRQAREGGRTRVASSLYVVSEVARRRPELVRWLTEPLPHDRHEEQATGEAPVFWETMLDEVDGRLHVFIVDWYIRRAMRHPGIEVADEVLALLDLVEAIGAEPGVSLSVPIAPGEVLWMHNRRVLLGREAYTDGLTPDTQRLLHRVWLDVDP